MTFDLAHYFIPLLVVLISIVVYQTLVYFYALKKVDNSIVDIFWGPGFFVAAVAAWDLAGFSRSIGSLVLLACIGIWGFRLAFYIISRHHRGEDPRYQKFRKEWKGNFAVQSYIWIFLMQAGLLAVIVFGSVHALLLDQFVVNWLFWTGVGVWAFGLLFETVGDMQLQVFIKKKKVGKVKHRFINEGLWKYTRHPNYFGEAVLWWGIFLMTVQSPLGWITIVSPLFITYLLRYVSGVPMMEVRYQGIKEWEEYAAKTSVFIPWFKKK